MNTTTEAVSPLDLAVGDQVIEADVTLRIAELNQEWTDARTGRLVRNWRTEYVSGTAPWADVQRWMVAGTYNIQGNELARVARLVG